jgi:ubiquinone/menaquinone biosynthesis C-methylase UbiE
MESLIPEIEPEQSAGLDISATRLREAKQRNPDADFYRAPVEGVPLKDDSFDLITCLDVIEHIKEPDKLL